MTRATKAKQKELNCSMWEREIRAYQKCEKKNRSPQGNAEDGGFELSAADTPDASVAAARPEGEEADETG